VRSIVARDNVARGSAVIPALEPSLESRIENGLRLLGMARAQPSALERKAGANHVDEESGALFWRTPSGALEIVAIEPIHTL